MTTIRQTFSSRLTTVITMVGISVGLGNVWRFPYMMGEYGGSAFLFVYLIFTILFAVPAVMAEWSLGRSTRQGPIGAFTAMWGKQVGLIIGCALLLTVLVAESYYIFIIANVGYSTFFSTLNGFDSSNIPVYNNYLNNPYLQYTICIFLLFLSYIAITRGLKKGMESISKIFVPFFLIVMLFLIVFALSLESTFENLTQFLKPNFSDLKATHVFSALGQSFFSLGLGGTFLVVFGSYMRAEEDLTKSSIFVAFGDVGAAIMAGLFIVPTVLALNLDMSQGPGLLFATLPELFQRLPYGQIIGSFFLFALFAVTFISSLAAIEVLLAGIGDSIEEKINRNRLTLYIVFAIAIILIPIAIDPSIIGILDLVFGSGMQVLGSLLAILAIAWGQKRAKMLKSVFGAEAKPWHTLYYYWVKWCLPTALLIVFVGYIVSKI
ncbi:sodium-dependent transporter [Bacteroidales bacterium AH-315-I05]|nr:sodium-dependent transporter [Bacteroidales bacterium AH-315-I05]